MATAAIDDQISAHQTSTHARLWFGLTTLLVLTLGAAEGWCGRTAAGDVYGSDAIQYLDIARAIARHDWKSALNPLWSQGYPALLALMRPLFAPGMNGDWATTRWLNLAIFGSSWLGFAWLVSELARALGRRIDRSLWLGFVAIFVTAQICVDQVSRVGPDQLVAAIFFVVCGLVLRLAERPRIGLAVALGVLLGAGFLVKAVFLPLGCAVLVVTAAALFWVDPTHRDTAAMNGARRLLGRVMIAAGLFAAIVLGYGVQLSKSVGKPTLGEAGALNYAWHVNRLAKWVHWQGGVDPAAKAWPKPWIARFAHWDSDPPDFGLPVHPSERVGSAPLLYVFHAPVVATYVPYFDPPYWYEGYRKVFRWRYQAIAVAKNLGDFAQVLGRQPLFWAWALAMAIGLWRRDERVRAGQRLMRVWPVAVIALVGVGIYLPVHLEGRYLSAFLAVLAVIGLLILPTSQKHPKMVVSLLLVGFAMGLVKDQREIWVRVLHGWTPRTNVEWRTAEGVRALGLPATSEVGVIGWTANLYCDWAYMSELRITSEIATPQDENAVWRASAERQAAVLQEFRAAGAKAVFSRDRPPVSAAGWEQVSGAPMWVHRL